MGELTDIQLYRVYNRLVSRVTRDSYGADWHTLYIVNRGLYWSLKSVVHEITRRHGV